MNKIKIIHVIGRLAFGGAERLLLDLCRKIDKNKFSVSVISIGAPSGLELEFENAGISVTNVIKKFKGDWRTLKQIKKIFRDEKPAVVHTHLFGGDFWGGLAALSCHVPVIISTKHDILHEGVLKNFLVNIVRRRFSRIIAISHASEKRLVEKDGIPKRKVSVIYNGIDISKFLVPRSQILRKDEIVFGTVGRLVRVKGHSTLIKACRFLKRDNWKLSIVGEGSEKPHLQKLIGQYQLKNKVTLLGQTVDVREALASMDVFVFPSLSEGLSVAVIEAAAAGKFIIAAKVGGVPEIIENNKSGILFDPYAIGELVEKMDWVFDHQDEARAMAQKLQAVVNEKFDINNIIKQYEDLYGNLLQKYESTSN